MCGRPWLPAHPDAAALGGTEQAILGLTAALAARGHSVCVAGATLTGRRLAGVDWMPAGEAAADVTVAINDATLLAGGGWPVVWFHNEVEVVREWRKGRLGALWRGRPAAVFIGGVQAAGASRLLGFRARAVIPYGVAARVLTAAPAAGVPGPEAVFTSQAYRGLAEVIAVWRARVAPVLPGARLRAFIGEGDLARFAALAAGVPSIAILPRIGGGAMPGMLRGSRVLVAPGHRSETFCMAAAEAVAMGVPVATLGVGSLRERVADGRTGCVAGSWRGLGAGIVRMLTDDALWTAMHRAGLAMRDDAGWDRAARAWETFAGEHIAGG